MLLAPHLNFGALQSSLQFLVLPCGGSEVLFQLKAAALCFRAVIVHLGPLDKLCQPNSKIFDFLLEEFFLLQPLVVAPPPRLDLVTRIRIQKLLSPLKGLILGLGQTPGCPQFRGKGFLGPQFLRRVLETQVPRSRFKGF